MPAVFEYRWKVSSDEIDELGHAGNVAYVHWMMAAAKAHSAAQGWPLERYRDCGFAWVVRSHRIDYLKSALANDEIVVRTWVGGYTQATSQRRYEILRVSDGALLVRAETEWAFVDTRTGSLRRIPPEVADSFPIVDGGR